MSEKPLVPWIIAENTGKIIAGHCNCMAGMGESCSHVASLLWAIESGVHIRDSLTPTDKKAYWVIPQAVKQVPFSPVKNINFKGKKRSLQQLNMPSIINDNQDSSASPTVASLLFANPETEPSTEPQVAEDIHTQPPNCSEDVVFTETDELTQLITTTASTDNDTGITGQQVQSSSATSTTVQTSQTHEPISSQLEHTRALHYISTLEQDCLCLFFDALTLCPGKPAVLAFSEQHCEPFIPKSLKQGLPKCLSELYNKEALEKFIVSF